MEAKKIKVLMIHPEENRSKYDFKGIIENECLDHEYVAAVLDRDKYEVGFWDGKIEDVSCKKRIEEFGPDVAFIAGRDFQEEYLIEYAQTVKTYNPEAITILGGIHAQLCYKRLYKEPVDFVLRSFDVFRVPEIIEAAKAKDYSSYEAIKDICYQLNGEWIENECVSFDIKRLPRPDRTYFYEHEDHYNYLELKHAAWVRTAYCCPYRCKFCMRNKMNLGVYTSRDIEDVVDEIAEIKTDNIYIVDDDFLVDEARLNRFMDLIEERQIKKTYICYGRSDFIATHEDIMKRLASIGFYYILVGLETIREGNMELYNKRNSINNNIESINICNKYGLEMMGMFILDLDFEKKDFKNLYKWVKEHNLKHVAVSIYTPEMGLETSDEFKDRMITDNPGHYDYLHLVCKPDKLSVNAYYRAYYILLIKLFLKAKKDGIYDFIDYGDYIRSFIGNILRKKRKDE